jgi:hypothetical protein
MCQRDVVVVKMVSLKRNATNNLLAILYSDFTIYDMQR